MQPVEINILANTEETVPVLADIVSSTGGETRAAPGGDDGFVGVVPSELAEDPDIAEVFLVGGGTALFEDSVTEEALKLAVTQPNLGFDQTLDVEAQNAVVNAFNDLRNGNLNQVSSQQVIDEIFEEDFTLAG